MMLTAFVMLFLAEAIDFGPDVTVRVSRPTVQYPGRDPATFESPKDEGASQTQTAAGE